VSFLRNVQNLVGQGREGNRSISGEETDGSKWSGHYSAKLLFYMPSGIIAVTMV
jgi:hypothetical protein